jgi:hypothetical protein
MTTAMLPSRGITKTRLSGLILEATATVVSLIMVLWLLLWFIGCLAQETPVAAFYVTAEDALVLDAPYQATDVRKLRGSASSNGQWEVKPSELVERVGEVLRNGSSKVVYVSAPMIAASRGSDGAISLDGIEGLIKSVAKEARGDVLLALDTAQVDSDRDIGVFGNSPYAGLAERLRGLKGGNRIMVLTSCAPAQKSWGSDGLGQSAFAYYLRKGLEGEALKWDRASEGLTTLGLYRYVRTHVQKWAQDHCGTVQTPMLIPVGDSALSFPLAKVPKDKSQVRAGPDSGASDATIADATTSKAEVKDAKKADEAQSKQVEASRATKRKDEPPGESGLREQLVQQILDEWEKYESLRKKEEQGEPPYRSFPGLWRHYQSGLISTERKVRIAWVDDEWIPQAQESLKSLGDERRGLEKQLDDRRLELARVIPFRPASDKAGKRLILDAVGLLIGEPLPSAPSEPRADPAGPMKQPINVALSEVTAGDYPRNFLELQLPVWAFRFTQQFRVADYFKMEPRKDQLRRLVDLRRGAEEVLAVDPRGVRYVESLVAKGDEARRRLQDELFLAASARDDAARAFPGRAREVEQYYETANEVIQAFRQARAALEKVAADFPALAEWSIRSRSHGMSGDPGGPRPGLPAPVQDVVDSVKSLIETLDQSIPKEQADEAVRRWSGPLRQSADAALKALKGLEMEFLDATQAGAPNNWIGRELALRNPLLRVERRRELLWRILRSSTETSVQPGEGSEAEAPTEYPHDRGFWSRAIGLAGLDVAMNRLGGVNPENRQREGLLSGLESRLADLSESKQGREVAEALISPTGDFRSFTDTTLRSRLAVARAAVPRRGELSLEDLHQGARLADRQVRFLSLGEIIGRGLTTIDGPVASLVRFGAYVSLAFHLNRLAADFTAPRYLDDLMEQVNSLGKAVGISREVEALPSIQSLSLKLEAQENPLKIGDSARAEFEVSLVAPRPAVGIGAIPDGMAFVGVLKGPDDPGARRPGEPEKKAPAGGPQWDFAAEGNEAKVLVPGLLLGQLVRVPPGLPPQPPTKVIVTQRDLRDSSGPLNLEARVFYRGRLDASGDSTVKVLPYESSKWLDVQIRQNRDSLRYPPEILAQIRDQFEVHPEFGAMHKGKSIAYVITVANVSPQTLKVRYKRSLIDPTNEKPEAIDKDFILKEVSPKDRFQIRGTINSEKVPVGTSRNLELKLIDERGNALIEPFVVRFIQIELKDYMVITTKVGQKNVKGVVTLCYLVSFSRKADDPVLEPITGPEINCLINGQPFEDDVSKLFLFPGETATIYQIVGEGVKPWKWSGKIENEDLPERQGTVNQ